VEIGSDFDPDVVVLDIGMPGLNRYEVPRRLRERDTGRRPLLVALSGLGQAEQPESQIWSSTSAARFSLPVRCDCHPS
jgi:CheY-like chemotaxis protein